MQASSWICPSAGHLGLVFTPTAPSLYRRPRCPTVHSYDPAALPPLTLSHRSLQRPCRSTAAHNVPPCTTTTRSLYRCPHYQSRRSTATHAVSPCTPIAPSLYRCSKDAQSLYHRQKYPVALPSPTQPRSSTAAHVASHSTVTHAARRSPIVDSVPLHDCRPHGPKRSTYGRLPPTWHHRSPVSLCSVSHSCHTTIF